MTVMEADKYLKTVCAAQILNFFNTSNQIHSMYQLCNTVYILSGVDNICKNMDAFSGTEHEIEGRVGTRTHFRRKNI